MMGAMRSKSLLLVMGLAFIAPAAQADSSFVGPPVLLTPPPGAGPSPCQSQNQLFAQEAEALIAEGINEERGKFAPDAPPLMPDINLTRIAQRRSCDMARGTSDFSHTDAQDNFIAGDMVRRIFGPYGSVGENIMEMGEERPASRSSGHARATNAASWGERPDGVPPFSAEQFAREAVEGWMKSPGHRENILNSRYDSSGIGVAMAGDRAFATQVFRGPPRVRNK
jgi:uncharacterized protein YkwD